MGGPRARWRSAAVVVALGVVSTTTQLSGQQPEYLPPRGEPEHVDVDLLVRWVESVERHEPGVLDAALLGAARWSSRDLRRLWADVQVLIRLAENPRTKRFRVASLPDPSGRWRESLSVSFARSSDKVIVDELVRRVGAIGLIPALKRGALVHTDVATLAAGLATESSAPTTAGSQVKTLVGDGNRAGTEGVSLHWSLARMLLWQLPPHPSAFPFVRDWFRATVAIAQHEEFWDAIQLDRGLDLFPTDPILLLLKGAQHEAYAAPLYQEFMRAFTGRTVRPDIDGTDAELDRAERAFRTALAGNPALVEARVRLGRVLGLKGERDAAMRELAQAIEAGLEPEIEYYARLFLGAEHQAAGGLAEARVQFRRAVAIEPDGRVPYLALAQIARALGDRDDTRANLDRALAPLASDRDVDPWWRYRVSQARRAEAWLDVVRRSWQRETP